MIDGTFRANLEETGMSYQLEVDCIHAAHELDGFYGASSLERLPTEHAIVAETRKFTALRRGKEKAPSPA